jgi:hypothetical protein
MSGAVLGIQMAYWQETLLKLGVGLAAVLLLTGMTLLADSHGAPLQGVLCQRMHRMCPDQEE